jgi:ligand-binding SRPBCC domain-containing protein
VTRPIEETFAFFADAENLQRLTPPWLDFSIVTPLPIEMRAGTVIDFKLRLYGVPLRWRSVIDEWQPPFRFVDTQVKGPYLVWRHTHSFESVTEGTVVRDTVEYRLVGGRLADALFVRRDLERIFTHRQKALLAHFAVEPAHPIAVVFP